MRAQDRLCLLPGRCADHVDRVVEMPLRFSRVQNTDGRLDGHYGAISSNRPWTKMFHSLMACMFDNRRKAKAKIRAPPRRCSKWGARGSGVGSSGSGIVMLWQA